ncbi:MAG: AtpZ/AtpI family protein [Pseudomonadota bacterium]
MTDDPDPDRLEALSEKLAAARAARTPEPAAENHISAAQQGWRMVTELVAGLLLGFGIGYGLDVLFGTLPILLVVFTLLGFIAGVRTMLRTAEDVARKNAAAAALDEISGPGRTPDPGEGRKHGD